MQSLDILFAQYGESHQNKVNIVIHKIFVPLIMLSVLGLLLAIPAPAFLRAAGLDWALIVSLLVLGYYLKLSKKYFLLMIPVLALMYLAVKELAALGPILWLSLAIFIVSWAFQFIGHKIEGKKPSFLQDLLFLLIGPLWVAKALFRIKS
ncbi:MAG: Mpo1-like protein [Bacteriovoracaceae bacterium]